MPANIVVPEVGESIVDARIAKWLRKEGDRVSTGDPLVELETEKIDLEVGAPAAGVLSRIDRKDGEEVVTRKVGRRRRALLDRVIVIAVALLVAFLVRTFVLAHFVVDGTSMATTLADDDRVFVNKLSYRLHDPNRGELDIPVPRGL